MASGFRELAGLDCAIAKDELSNRNPPQAQAFVGKHA